MIMIFCLQNTFGKIIDEPMKISNLLIYKLKSIANQGPIGHFQTMIKQSQITNTSMEF